MPLTPPKTLEIQEKTTGVYTATLKDENGTAIALSDVTSITMTLVEDSTGTVVNSRDSQNVLNTGNCTFHATSGLFTWNIQVGDTTLVNTEVSSGNYEIHVATITIIWNTSKRMHREIRLKIYNLRSVS